MVTDGATFGWVADVVVLPDHRGQGLGKALIESVLADNGLCSMERLLLGTRARMACTRNMASYAITGAGSMERLGLDQTDLASSDRPQPTS